MFMKSLQVFFFILFLTTITQAQVYEFTPIVEQESLPVISQDNTGTCWSFSTSSFLESEIIRITGKKIDLSEMYQVRQTYPLKAENFIHRQGKAQFSEGGLAHDVLNSIKEYGMVPAESYLGLRINENKHNHAEMVEVIEAMLKTYVNNTSKKISPQWKPAISAVLDVYLGAIPREFVYEGKKYTPKTFQEMTGIAPDNYVTLTSFTHAPFYKPMILNIPDNFSNGMMYNLPLDEFMANIDFALSEGFTLSLDCDVSEPTFSAKTGVAVIPKNSDDAKLIVSELKPEKEITQSYRQEEFENYSTTDDHLMQLVGKAKDQNGNIYYKVKNSWGSNPSRVAYDGYIYMSASYMRLKSISVLLHKEGILPATKTAVKL